LVEGLEAVTYLDTHVAAWLYAGRVDLLSPRAVAVIEAEDELAISPAVVLELEYLHEIGRLTVGGNAVAQSLSAQIGLAVHDVPFARVIESALDLDWTRDPFDRMIVAQAGLSGSALLTKDRSIRRRYRQATW
jgi:PIN domain nuclease of toxin-antitoxin system